ncbi:MAG: SRPBCC family protein [Acidimicrobiales bacterium]
MELTNDFRVSVPPAKAWAVLTDVERIAPLLPGAQLQEIDGDEFRGVVKVKVGPITAQYKGTASWQEKDEAARRAVLKASGRDTRGQGNASATISMSLEPDGDGTKVDVVTDLTITGKVAQFGRGVLADVSGKLLGQFVDALEADLEREGTVGSPPPAPPGPLLAGGAGGEPTAASTVASTAADGAGGSSTEQPESSTEPGSEATAATAPSAGEAPPSGPRRIDQPEPEPVDLVGVAGRSVAKRLLPVLGGLGVLAVLVFLRRVRRR